MPVASFGALTVSSGKHEMELIVIEETVGRFNDAALKFVFECMEGSNQGHQARKTVGMNFAADTTAGAFVASLVGRQLGRNDSVELNDLIGQRFVVNVVGAQIAKISPVAKV